MRKIITFLALSVFVWLWPQHATAQLETGLNLQSPEFASDNPELETLIGEAESLFSLSQPIDARAKLLKAIQIAPQDFRPQLLLGIYYLSEVGHFQLAYKYVSNALWNFEKKYGTDSDQSVFFYPGNAWRYHAYLLQVLSEAKLNLDDYQGALDVLDRLDASYRTTTSVSSRAWILMKLGRIDEGLKVVENSLNQKSNPGSLYNIYGILLSLKGDREESLRAFAQAISAEKLLYSMGQVATPLNNAGEVYNELFRDREAEAAWIKALSFPEGCDHILTSLNLTLLQINELRLLQAERTLSDFEACYAANPVRSDSEHRALLALGRGKIALRKGDPALALQELTKASEREQWFGKIGTNQNDVQFAASQSLAQALLGQANAFHDHVATSLKDSFETFITSRWNTIRAYWLLKQARNMALSELNDFEDLFIRHTDAMLEYPTLGIIISGYPLEAAERRLTRMLANDNRKPAHSYYRLFLGFAQLEHGEAKRAGDTFNSVYSEFRPFDRLARAEALAGLIKSGDAQLSWWRANEEARQSIDKNIETLYELLPSYIRYYDFRLPVTLEVSASDDSAKRIALRLQKMLTHSRFKEASPISNSRYRLDITVEKTDSPDRFISTVVLVSKGTNSPLAKVSETIQGAYTDCANLSNKFIAKAFSHRVDPSAEQLPTLSILNDIDDSGI